ncbi:amidohydrolase family protein [Microbacterium sp. Marseille-Q6965]|uniref:amidohydrolase family protein n=1 Tax=Microbacterium sp. Marseille-Q6965 TaxID=2965072 RepID=UPI0021B795F5|nr:amidohydrolase family protein [Microbacterium sp. Marseille-Q6965]
MPSPDVLITHARLIVTADRVLDDAWMHVRDGLVAAVGEGAPPSVDVPVVDVGGAFVAPGFVSSHSHLATSGSRGLGNDEPLYGWCEKMYGVTRNARAEDIYWCTLHGALDVLAAGITTAWDFTERRTTWEPMRDGRRDTIGRLREPEFSLRQLDAKLDAGIRFVHAEYLDEGHGDDAATVARVEDVLAYAAGKRGDRFLGVALAGGQQWSSSPRTAEIEVELMRRHGLRNQAHLLETNSRVDIQRTKFDWYRDAGALGTTMIFGHFVHAGDRIVAEAAEAGCGFSWQPTANGRLGSGIADVAQWRRRGARVGLGIDDQACTDLADPWQNMRMGLYAVRAAEQDPTVLGAADVLRMHTAGAADLLGVGDRVGTLEPGKSADFLVVDPRSPDVGPVWDPIGTYVLACGTRNLREVWVGGERLVSEGRVESPLAAEASRQIHERLPRLAAQG